MKTPRQFTDEALRLTEIKPLKSFGQNFLVDKNILNKMISHSKISEADNIMEIGPGIGILTQEFIQKGSHVLAIEKDKRLFSYLKNKFARDSRIDLIQGDILKIPFDRSLLPSPPYKIISNLPYNISSQVIIKIIMASEFFPEVYIGLQNEVAMRLASKEGSKVYGLLSPLLQMEYRAKILFTIPPRSFHPSPKVTSAFLSLERIRQLDTENKKAFFLFLKKSFSQRRKKLVNNLKSSYEDKKIKTAFHTCSIMENARAESISPETFYKLFKIMQEK